MLLASYKITSTRWWRRLLYQRIYYHVNRILWFDHNLLQKARERFPEKVVQGSSSALRAWFSSPNLGSWHPLRYLCCPALLWLLVNRVQGSLGSEGYRPSLCRCLGYLTVQLLLAKDLKVFGLASCVPFAASLVPCPSFWPLQSFVVLWVFCASPCLRASNRANRHLELAAIFYQQNNSPGRSQNGISW